jgi:hypothetical protein
MREPTFSDPKAARWVDLFQKRARFTGQLPEPDVLQRMGIPADDPFWKQDNANPSAGFAVNLGCRVGDALQLDSPANFDAVGVDDFGRSVTKFPILETAPHFYFHIASSTFLLDEASRVITPGHHLARCSPMAFQRWISCFALPWLLFGYHLQTLTDSNRWNPYGCRRA